MRRLALTVAALCFLGGTARADEEKVPLDKLPKAVVETVKKRFPKAELVSASKEDENGKTEYEVQIKDGGTKLDVTVTPEGTLVSIEKEITAKNLPKAVTETLDAKYPKATFKVVEEITKVKDGKDQPVYYEVLLVTADKKTFEVELAADGKILATEEKKAKTEEKKEEKKEKSEKGEKGEKGDLPKGLASALKSKFPGAKVVDVDEEDEDGKTVYEVTLSYKAGTIEAILTAKGEILKVKLKGKKEDDDEKGAKASSKKGKKGDDDDDDDKKASSKKGKKGDDEDDDKDEKKAGAKKGKKGDDDDDKGEKKAGSKKSKKGDDDDDDKDEKGEKNQKGKNEKGQKNQKGERD
jgi:hypothetical protein